MNTSTALMELPRCSYGVSHRLIELEMTWMWCLTFLICVQAKLFSSDRLLALRASNQLRRDVDPPAANMVKLRWDKHLAQLAQLAADNCTLDFSSPELNGDSVDFSPGFQYGPRKEDGSIERVILSWGHNKDHLNVTDSKTTKYGLQYTRAVRASTDLIGCGHNLCDRTMSPDGVGWFVCESFGGCDLYVCAYSQKLVIPEDIGQEETFFDILEQVYQVGEPCSQCPSDKPYCNAKLCSDVAPNPESSQDTLRQDSTNKSEKTEPKDEL